MVVATPMAVSTAGPRHVPASRPSPTAMIAIAAMVHALAGSLSNTMPPMADKNAPPPRAIGYTCEKSPWPYARASKMRYGKCTQPDSTAQIQPCDVMPPATTRPTTANSPPKMNWAHNATKRSCAVCFTAKFQAACNTAAVRASSVAVSTSTKDTWVPLASP